MSDPKRGPSQRNAMEEQAIEATKQRYSSPPPETVEGPDFREAPNQEPDQEVIAKQLREETDRLCQQHALNEEAGARQAALRNWMSSTLATLVHLCPATEERALAITKAREALMWGNLAISLHQDKLPGMVPRHGQGQESPGSGD